MMLQSRPVQRKIWILDGHVGLKRTVLAAVRKGPVPKIDNADKFI